MEKVLNSQQKRSGLSALNALALAGVVAGGAMLNGQIATTAYRALGQEDLSRNAVNRLQGTELRAPNGIAIDARNGSARIYIADTANNRVLGWRDARAYKMGEPPALVLGQFSLQRSVPLGIGSGGLSCLPA